MNDVSNVIPSVIDRFDGHFGFLSSFHPSRIKVSVDPDGPPIECPTVEHAFHWFKTHVPEEKAAILAAPTPGKAKALGRRCTLRDDWEHIKVTIMSGLVGLKFQDPELAMKLLATMPATLVEGNDWGDNIWGATAPGGLKMVESDEVLRWETPHGPLQGQNHLGRILMHTRTVIRLQTLFPAGVVVASL